MGTVSEWGRSISYFLQNSSFLPACPGRLLQCIVIMTATAWHVQIDDPGLKQQALRSLAFRVAPYSSLVQSVTLMREPAGRGLWRVRADCRTLRGTWIIEDVRGDDCAALTAVIQRIESR